MFYSEMVLKAAKIASEAHVGQYDKAGYPYIMHPYHLAEGFSDEASVIVALLHDVVEDTDWTLEALEKEGFSREVIKALSLLTHAKGVPYLEYVARIAGDPLARRVKIADLRHNLDETRGANTQHLLNKREECYYPALKLLLQAEEDEK